MKEKCHDADLRGLDFDEKVEAIAHWKMAKRWFYVPLDLYDGMMSPYTTARFDTVYSCLDFHQLDENGKAASLGEIQRVLKKGGRLIVADWGGAANRRR